MNWLQRIKNLVGYGQSASAEDSQEPQTASPVAVESPAPSPIDADSPPPSEAEAAPLAAASSPTGARVHKKKRVLLVEGDFMALGQVSRTLEPLRSHWDMIFTANPNEALQLLHRQPCDAVVAGLTLSGTTGVGLLNHVTQQHPHVLRFIRCTPEERKEISGFAGTPPQHFSTELDADGALAVVRRAFLLDHWFRNPEIQALLSKLHKLPALPTLHTQILHELQSPDADFEAVARLIAQDPVMTAKMLQLVNSAYFALPREITESMEAVMLLGAERTRSLIMLAKVFSQFDKTQCEGFKIEELWRHSMAVGSYAHIICLTETRDTRLADEAFTAGLLHDVGKLLLAGNLPADYARVLDQAKRRKLSMRDAELEVFGATHAELGACLLGNWGLPLGILEAIGWHNRPLFSDDAGFSLLTAVHVANAIDHEKAAEAADILVSMMDGAYTERLGLSGRRNRWREMCESTPKPTDEVPTFE
jgi:HD-like signal output (HDOD) protein